MALSLRQKSAVRRHLQYPVAGLVRTSVAGGTLAAGAVGYRFSQAYGFLEWKLNNLNPDEEARLTGYAYGSVALIGPTPHVGDSVSVQISGGNLTVSPQIITSVVPSGLTVDPALFLVLDLAAQTSLNTACQIAGIIGVAPYGTGAFSQNSVPFPEVAFTSPTAFVLTASGTGVLAPQITADGDQLTPKTSLDGGRTTIYGYINILNGLQDAIWTASDNLDTLQAGPWRARANEIGYRLSLYRNAQQSFSDFLGTPINPQRMNYARNVGALRYA